MERNEHSLVPAWLKGAAGVSVHQSSLYTDNGGSSIVLRPRAAHTPLAHSEFDSSRGVSLSSDRVLFSPSRKNHSSALERVSTERDNVVFGRSYSGLGRSSIARSHTKPDQDRDGYRGDVDSWSRGRETVEFGSDEREKGRERMDNGSVQSFSGPLSKYDSEARLRRSQSMGLSHRVAENGSWKMNETLNQSSALPAVGGGGLATSIQKAAFEWDFPSLGAEEKQFGYLSSCTASPRHLWQGSPRPDMVRASSPGLAGTFSSSISAASSSIVGGGVGGSDVWTSALAEAPPLNGSSQSSGLSSNVLPGSIMGQTSCGSFVPSPTISSVVMNMAEALTQNPPRARTPPQLSLENQRLEELALKQSRQLIPMIRQTMSLTDKGKSKPARLDGIAPGTKVNQLSGSLQANPHRTSGPVRPDTPKHSLGKLLVLKPSKEGGAAASSSLKTDGPNSPQATAQGNLSGSTSSANGAVSAVALQRKPSFDRKGSSSTGLPGADTSGGLRAKDLSSTIEEKRPSLQAQNRSEFFNTLRKQAAGNGGSFNAKKNVSAVQTNSDDICASRSQFSQASGSELKQNGASWNSQSFPCIDKIHSNGDSKHMPANGLITDKVGSRVEEPLAIKSLDESVGISMPVDSEEEEAAFMRSLGWEENEEGSELTEEEINAFYQMREMKNLLSNRGNHKLKNSAIEHCVSSSIGSLSSVISSSDSDSDDDHL